MLTKRTLLSILSAFLFIALVVSCNKTELTTPEEISLNKEDDLSLLPGDLSPTNQKIELGRRIFFDLGQSVSGTSEVLVQSCASCHLPAQGFAAFATKPTGGIPRGFVAGFAEGAFAGRFGGRKPPSAAYATFSPVMHVDIDPLEPEEGAQFKGGLFWDGRATGKRLGSPAAEQATPPFVNSVEQNHPNPKSVLLRIQANPTVYAQFWKAVWGSPLNITDNTSEAEIQMNFDRVGKSIAAFERSKKVNKFNSKFDKFLKGEVVLTEIEKTGLALFTGKANCATCHELEIGSTSKTVFTDHSYYNLGLPSNFEQPNKIDNFPFIGPDPGLGGFLKSLGASHPWYQYADENIGRFKTPTVRNVAKGSSNKRFMHNGVFNSLKQVVHFYNTRDVPEAGWAKPELAENLEKRRMGNLGLTGTEEDAIVEFLKTLSDK